MKVADLNNQAARLIDAGQLDAAAGVLEQVAAIIDARPRAPVDWRNFEPAFDEYFYRTHRITIGWHREQYAETLPYAERAFELEYAIVAAAKQTDIRGISPFAYSTGAWGLISLLTRCGRFEDAASAFEKVLEDGWFWARSNRKRAAAEDLLMAGVCIYLEHRDPAWLKRGRSQMERARRLLSPDRTGLVYNWAVYWTLVGDKRLALEMVDTLTRHDFGLEKLLADPSFVALHGEPRWQSDVVDRVLTWRFSSEPPGARVFIDGTDTGIDTPGRMRPPPRGRHHIRLVLAGHRDVEQTHEPIAGGFEASFRLEPSHLADERDRLVTEMARDAMRVPDAAARKRTRDFVGKRKHASIRVARATTYGLGGLDVTVHGDGSVLLRRLPFLATEKVQTLTVKLDATPLFETFINEAFTEMVLAPIPGQPDEFYFTIELTGAGGETHTLSKLGSTRHPRFDRLVGLVYMTVGAQLGATERAAFTI
ncbi:MAG: PEGA domain-containing protein [Deltaproteobacteria bacterium]|nr:PEGA domain-containing protein [Deltaproteobacteria bacterium]MDQ3299090.1 PEGA domain-containing protein [Myxococcota bacterium]